MQRGNKLCGSHRMIILEHCRAMLQHEDQQTLIERPTLDVDVLEELSRTITEAMERGRLMLPRVFSPTGIVEIDMVPQTGLGRQIARIDRGGSLMRVKT